MRKRRERGWSCTRLFMLFAREADPETLRRDKWNCDVRKSRNNSAAVPDCAEPSEACGSGGTVLLWRWRTGREMAMQEHRSSVSLVRDAERNGLTIEDEPECRGGDGFESSQCPPLILELRSKGRVDEAASLRR